MALIAKHGDTQFGVGDTIRVSQLIEEKGKSRTQVFEGMVLGIKGRGMSKTFVVRRIGAAQVGIEKIFPLNAPTVQKVEVVKSGVKGTRHAKLYYTRDKSAREIKKIYTRASLKEGSEPKAKQKPKTKSKTSKKIKSKKTPQAKASSPARASKRTGKTANAKSSKSKK